MVKGFNFEKNSIFENGDCGNTYDKKVYSAKVQARLVPLRTNSLGFLQIICYPYLTNTRFLDKILSMIDILNDFKTPHEIQMIIANNVRNRRKALKLNQEDFAKKCGVSFGSYKRFENTGEISLASLVKIGSILGYNDDLTNLFSRKEYTSIEEVINDRSK